MKTKAFELESTFAVLSPGGKATTVDVSPTLYQDLDRMFDGFKGSHLVSCHDFVADWPSWEMHPAGDEVVYLVSGEACFVFEHGAAEEIVQLRQAGSYVIVPKGTWHTARIEHEAKMIFITPGEGTQNRPL